jgi:hypothetical protein
MERDRTQRWLTQGRALVVNRSGVVFTPTYAFASAASHQSDDHATSVLSAVTMDSVTPLWAKEIQNAASDDEAKEKILDFLREMHHDDDEQ